MAPPDAPRMANRVHALDGLRGLAALAVVLAKYWADLPAAWRTPFLGVVVWPPFTFLLNARGPVILFFMLSGFVLALSLHRAGAPVLDQYVPFLVRRLCRIWLPYAAVLCVSAFIGAALYRSGRVEPPGWEPVYWPGAPDWTALGQQILLRYTIPPLNPPGWSLVTELQISAVFPILLLGLRRGPAPVVGVFLAVALAANLAAPAANVQSFRFVLFFMLGALLALHRHRAIALAQPVLRHPRVTAVLSLLCLGLAPSHWYSDLTMAAGAAGVMLLALAAPGAQAFLLRPTIQTLGRVSYSLYLTNTITLHALAAWLGPRLPVPVILALGIPAIAVATWASFTLLENPSARLGGLLTRRRRVAVA